MKTDWKCIAVIAIALVLGAGMLALPAAARGGGFGGGIGGGIGGIGGGIGGIGDRGFIGGGIGGIGDRGFAGGGIGGIGDRGVAWHGGDWDRWHGGGWNRWGGWGGGYPWYGYNYPIYAPAYYGGSQGACYEACVASGQYPPAQCGQMCYYA